LSPLAEVEAKTLGGANCVTSLSDGRRKIGVLLFPDRLAEFDVLDALCTIEFRSLVRSPSPVTFAVAANYGDSARNFVLLGGSALRRF
jgi:hypothetical protein